MCVNCISGAEHFAAQAAFAVAVLREPLHQALAGAGIVAPPDPVGRDARTVGFLRALDLEPLEILGAEAVERADAWVPRSRRQGRGWRWLRPIGSQSLLSTQ